MFWPPTTTSVDEDVRGRGEEGQGGHQGEDREDEQTDAVQHDGRELPVVDDQRFLFTGLDCLSDQPAHNPAFRKITNFPKFWSRKLAWNP